VPRFVYRALDDRGEIVEGELESADRGSLVETLRRQGFRPLHTAMLDTPNRSRSGRLQMSLARGPKAGKADLLHFTRELATLLQAQLPLDQALSTIAEQADRPTIAELTREVRNRLRRGTSLADSLAAQPERFPAHYVGLVRAGEAGGNLDRVFADLAGTLERTNALEQEIRSALTYPSLVLAAAGISILVLLLGVIPEFEPLFAGAGGDLPVTAAAVLAVSHGLRVYWWALPLFLLLLLWVIRSFRNNDAVKARADALLLRLPVIGALIHKIEAARFCRTLGALLENGVDIVPALQMGTKTIANRRLAKMVERVVPQLRRGEGLTGPLRRSGVLPPLAARLAEIGETSGQLGRMLQTVARIYDEEIRRETGRLVALVAPVVTLFIGLIVFAVIGSILSAILTSYELPF